MKLMKIEDRFPRYIMKNGVGCSALYLTQLKNRGSIIHCRNCAKEFMSREDHETTLMKGVLEVTRICETCGEVINQDDS